MNTEARDFSIMVGLIVQDLGFDLDQIKEAHAYLDTLMHARLRSHGDQDRLSIMLVGLHRELGEVMTRIPNMTKLAEKIGAALS